MNYPREPVCEYECILTKNLSICKSENKHCEYLYPYNALRYCKKAKCSRNAEETFLREKKLMLEMTARDGEQYHEQTKYVNNRRTARPINPNEPMGEGV
jgi:hypothetical protein